MDIAWSGNRLSALLRRLGSARIVLLIAAVIIALLLFGWIISLVIQRTRTSQLLAALWVSYKQTIWIRASGRTADEQNHSVTTSEGQAYTLLRAAWSGDRPTFDAAWQWTAVNLQRPDKLFSWRWGVRPDGTNGILTGQGGQATASDADTDIALALLMAAGRWRSRTYAAAARAIIPSIWDQEVVAAHGRYYIAADDIEKGAATPWFIINPSYAAPYAYRIFSRIDPQHDWNALAGDSYVMFRQTGYADLASQPGCGLPPDWAAIDRRTGAITPSPNNRQDTNFGYNALRIPWRAALDWQWFHEPEAKRALEQFGFLRQEWQQHGKLLAIYAHSCRPAADYTSYAFYGGTLGYFQVLHRPVAAAIIRSQFNPLLGTNSQQPLRYYDNNWAWFGLALYGGRLPNLAATGVPA